MDPYKTQFQTDILSGRATIKATGDYFKETGRSYKNYLQENWYRKAPGTGLYVSRLGFGTYRANKDIRAHFNALREALLSGTNVIDTAANFNEGASETLVGGVLRELIQAGRISREQVVVLSKAGFIQGKRLQSMKNTPDAYPEVVELNPSLRHCIHPDFIRDELSLSRRRMGLETVDVYLLHNPEIYLEHALARGVPSFEAREIFDDRLKRAFATLEELRLAGKIASFGVSSNNLAHNADEYTAVRLEQILTFAPPGFRVLQFPGNLLESDFRFNQGASGGALPTQATRAGIWCLSNRPLNARYQDQSLLRLARMVSPPPDEGAGVAAELNRLISELDELEARIIEFFRSNHFLFDRRTPAFAGVIKRYRDTFIGKEHLRDSLPEITRLIQKTVNQLFLLADTKPKHYVMENYSRLCNSILLTWERYADYLQHQQLGPLEEGLEKSHPALAGRPLAIQALLFLLSSRVPTTVLVGMRQIEYVRQLRKVYELDPPEETAAFQIFSGAADIVDELKTPNEPLQQFHRY